MDFKALVINHLISKNYYLAKIFYHARLYAYQHSKQPIVIYQMGKVGSTSIMHSLQRSKLNLPVFQVHALSKQGLAEMEQKYWGPPPHLFRRALLPETKHIFVGHFLRSQLQKNPISPKWKVITLVRDPIARNVSEFFYSIDTTKHDPYLPNFYERYEANKIGPTEILERFLERFDETSSDYHLPLTWFDAELKGVLGINVFSTEFPKTQGYQIYHGETADVLLIKLEKIQNIPLDLFNKFLNLAEFKLEKQNSAKNKRYYPAYKNFIKTAALPHQYVNKIYNSKYVSHFYSEEERNMFRRKWSKIEVASV